MNLLNIIIMLLISFSTTFLFFQIIARIFRQQPAPKVIPVKTQRFFRRRGN